MLSKLTEYSRFVESQRNEQGQTKIWVMTYNSRSEPFHLHSSSLCSPEGYVAKSERSIEICTRGVSQ